MMAEKARHFGDERALRQIMATWSPAEQKAIGRTVRGFDSAEWAKVSYQVVLRGTVAKYGQNSELLELLLATGDDCFVEASPYDRIWGIGMGEDDPRCLDPSQWQGQNLLGRAINEAREILRGGR